MPGEVAAVPLGWSSAALRRVKALWLKMAPADRLTQSLVAVGALGACVLGFRLYKRHARAAKKAHRNSQLLDYALAAVASWQLALDTPQDLEISPVSGGLSNYIYLVQLRPAVAAALAAEGLLLGSGGRVPRRVILRVFGENRDVLLEGEREIAVSQALSDLGLGVRVFGGTDEYRCEEFIVGKAMTRAVFASNAGLRNQALARVAALHDSSEAITGKMKGMGLPVHLGTAQLWVNMDRWLALIPHSHMLRSTLERELEWLRGRVQQCPSDSALSDLVFCHNDCQELNFMIDDAETKVEQMIDYEYAGVNMRGFDLAQVVNETYIDNEAEGYPGFEVVEADFEDAKLRASVMAAYFSAAKKARACEGGADEEVLRVLVMANHLMWAVWAVVQSRQDSLAFSYSEYAAARFSLYKRVKKDMSA